MKKIDTEFYRERLLQIRCRLLSDVTHMADSALHGADEPGETGVVDSGETGSGNYEQDATLSLLRHDEDLLKQVEDALERIDDGHYGSCDECGQKIPRTRLNAIPYTLYCVKCATRME